MLHPLTSKKMENRNAYYRHPSYYLERRLLQAIKSGAYTTSASLLDQINSLERAKLAQTPMRSVKNSLICSCTLFARAAIEGNVNPEEAFSLSDYLILEIEAFNDIRSLSRYEYYMAQEYVTLVQKARLHNYSSAVTRMIHHIHTHLSDPIRLEDFSLMTGRSKNYLSACFKDEVGITVSTYIQEAKLEESQHFLLLTDMPIIDIASLFGYNSATYFIRVFKKQYGITPAAYRKRQGQL